MVPLYWCMNGFRQLPFHCRCFQRLPAGDTHCYSHGEELWHVRKGTKQPLRQSFCNQGVCWDWINLASWKWSRGDPNSNLPGWSSLNSPIATLSPLESGGLQFQLAKLIQSQQSQCNPIPLAGLIDCIYIPLRLFSALKQTHCHWSLLYTTILSSQADSLHSSHMWLWMDD